MTNQSKKKKKKSKKETIDSNEIRIRCESCGNNTMYKPGERCSSCGAFV